MRNCQIWLSMHVKILQKNEFVENVLPANQALFIFVSTHCVETVKWLDYNHYLQLTRWCSGKAFALGARGPGFNSLLWQGFLRLIFCYVGLCIYFLCPEHYLSQNFAIFFSIIIYFVYVTYCKICDRFQGDTDTDLASLTSVSTII